MRLHGSHSCTNTESQVVAVYARQSTLIESEPVVSTINDLVDEAAVAWPDEPAITFFQQAGAEYTFGELRRLSCALAGVLHGAGVGHGTRVAVVLPNVPLYPLTWLALARLGAVMVPVNPRFTSDEMHFVLSDTNATYAIVDHSVLATFRSAETDCGSVRRVVVTTPDAPLTLTIDGEITTLDVAPEVPDFRITVSADDVVGIHYTSGTTGFPKGCVLTHRSWVVSATVTMSLLPSRPRRILSDAPYFYLDAPLETLGAMVVGAQQFIADRVSLGRFTRWLADLDIDYVEMWDALGESVPEPEAEARLRGRGRPLMCSSFGMTDEHRQALEARLGAVIREMYGMTEIGLGTAVPFSLADTPPGTCGLAAPFRETRIVDPDTGFDVRPGSVGELWVRGPGVFLEYHARPDVNQATRADGGWFRTGDLMRCDDHGFHFMVGRLKDMIRRSDENIAAAEVEAALAAVEIVQEAAVVGVPDPLRGQEVKAYIVLASGLAPSARAATDILAESARHLAPFKVPRYVEFVTTLPRTPSGKVAKVDLRHGDSSPVPRGFDRVDIAWRR